MKEWKLLLALFVQIGCSDNGGGIIWRRMDFFWENGQIVSRDQTLQVIDSIQSSPVDIMKIRAIIFGATGMVGEGVLHECLKSPQVESVLVIGRRACEVTHEKLAELFHKDFFDYSALEAKLKGYNACFFCLGVSSIGMKEEEYSRLTFDLTLAVASALSRLNPDMTFCYVSGTGTDTSETGKMMWARVKGKTENNLLKLPFKAAFMFRPGYIRPIKGLKRTMRFSAVLSPAYPALKLLFPGSVCTLEDLGRAMIHAAEKGYPKRILENRDIADLAEG